MAAIFTLNHSHAQTGGFAVTERGADWRVLSKTTMEHGTNRVHRYTELATGLNYTNSYGQLTESKEQITILPTGGAAATQGRHKVYFPADIYNGVLEVVTPDGRHLKSRPLGISYDDGSNTVFIATLTNSIGVLTASNQVTYPNAFTDFRADLVCTYRRGGFECDLVFREKLSTPDAYGLDADNSTLQMVTEFFNTADPQEIPAGSDDWFSLQDSTLKFGSLTMTHGKAFAIGDPRPSDGRGQGEGKVSVYKRWLNLQGRKFLIEEVPLVYLADDLDALPLTSSIQKPASHIASKPTKNGNIKLFASNGRVFPASHEFAVDTKQILIASADLNQQPGVVLDYNEIDSNQDSFTFVSGTTYYINGSFFLTGPTIFEGGTILKYNWNGEIDTDGYDSIAFPDNSDHPAVFTSFNDDSIGEIIDGSNGTPGPGDVYLFLYFEQNITISNARFNYANTCLYGFENNLDIWNCQFLNSNLAIQGYGSDLALHNVLLSYCNYGGNGAVWTENGLITGENITADENANGNVLFADITAAYLTNCLFTFSGSFSDYSSRYIITTNHVVFLPTPSSSIYQTAANANYYLAASSPYRDIGTTGINPDLLTELATMTTYAPQDGGYPDTNAPDLGYHYPVNEDSDYDGLPDWWEWHWFGSYAHTGSELDANGNSFLYDYQNSSDPNPIAFNLSATSLYVNHTNVSLQIELSGGIPSYIAVLVNDTNYANAVWQAYAGTNIAASLGTTDGVYNVWIGLRGWPADAQQTWDTGDITFTLDRVPPVITVTNPMIASGTATVIKPYLQLQGCGNEPLFGVSYDVTNAMGLVTNLDGYVTDQILDSNRNDFTTNYFQCYDLPLTNGVNTITLRCTDRAGNLTTTNFNVTLDYATATNPPVMNIIWPQDNMAIWGTNFYLRGHINDETATVTAQIVDAAGNTNTSGGLVERNGMFWVENLPLTTNGINIITVKATDAAGNVTTTNLTVFESEVSLTIDSTPTGDNLYEPKGTVSGTVSDGTWEVYVNGTRANVSSNDNGAGTYSWEADNVPVNGRGTATFDAMALPSGAAPPPANKSSAVEMQPMVKIVGYGDNQTDKYYHNTDLMTDWEWTKTYSAKYQQGQNDPLSYTETADEYVLDDYYFQSATSYDWSDTNPEGNETTEAWDGSFDTGLPIRNDENWIWGNLKSVPDVNYTGSLGDHDTFINQYCANGAQYHRNWFWSAGTAHEDITISAHTQVKLYTGGKAEISRRNLFCVSASAEKFLGLKYGYWDRNWIHIPAEDMDKTKLTVLGKQPGADGNLWVVLPDNSEQDITVTAPAKHYDASAGAAKYKLVVSANYTPLDPDVVVDGATNFWVGQDMTFTAGFDPALPESPVISPAKWSFDGLFKNDSVQPYPNGSVNYFMNADKLSNPLTTAWWVAGNDSKQFVSQLTANFAEGLTFANGQYVALARKGLFDMIRPQEKILAWTSSVNVYGDLLIFAVYTNSILASSGITFSYTALANLPGQFQWAQVVSSTVRQLQDSSLTWHTQTESTPPPYLDADPYTAIDPDTGFPVDSPNQGLDYRWENIRGVASDSFEMWMMFQFTGATHPVPLRAVIWSWSGTATNSPSGWGLQSGTCSPNPSDFDTVDYPLWNSDVRSHEWLP